MNQENISKRIVGLLLLMVFCISILPKAYFHDVFADHKDVLTCNLPHKSSAVHTKGFECHFDDLVVNAPFIDNDTPADVPVPESFRLQTETGNFLFLSVSPSCRANRGPPAV